MPYDAFNQYDLYKSIETASFDRTKVDALRCEMYQKMFRINPCERPSMSEL